MNKWLSKLWDTFCVVTLVGIWPRFIAPNLIKIESITLPIPRLNPKLDGLKIVQLSDLHFKESTSKRFLEKIRKNIEELKPDLILFTGDFICYSKLENPMGLIEFLRSLQAPLGSFAILGNHDYEKATHINEEGDYDVLQEGSFDLFRAIKRVFSQIKLTGKVTRDAQNVGFHEELNRCIQEGSFKLLHNQTEKVSYKGASFNISGVGEYILGKCRPDVTFLGVDTSLFNLLLAHNPDSIPSLLECPGDVILCGHTHGYQINLPWIRKKISLREHQEFIKGLHQKMNKWIYINRGIGSAFEFRWFSRPEITLITLKSD